LKGASTLPGYSPIRANESDPAKQNRSEMHRDQASGCGRWVCCRCFQAPSSGPVTWPRQQSATPRRPQNASAPSGRPRPRSKTRSSTRPPNHLAVERARKEQRKLRALLEFVVRSGRRLMLDICIPNATLWQTFADDTLEGPGLKSIADYATVLNSFAEQGDFPKGRPPAVPGAGQQPLRPVERRCVLGHHQELRRTHRRSRSGPGRRQRGRREWRRRRWPRAPHPTRQTGRAPVRRARPAGQDLGSSG
jgi:hypothetical protein